MAIPIQLPPKTCLTASGCLIHGNRILLVKHKKAKIWLKPGGHVEPNEMPHHAAEREFLEETGIKVTTTKYGLFPKRKDVTSVFMPVPFAANLHWVSKANYEERRKTGKVDVEKSAWKKDCEQHLNYDFLVEPTGSLEFTADENESDGIGWFSLKDLLDLETTEDVKNEIKYAFQLVLRQPLKKNS